MEDPIQKSLGKTSVPVPVAHAPIVSPLARVSVLHGYQKTVKPLGKTAIPTIAQQP